jgi:hypothetical protein
MRHGTWLLLSLGLAASAGAEPVAPPQPEAKPMKQAEYTIDDKPVTEAVFLQKRGALHGEHRYHCKKTATGGVNSYEAQDERGAWFLVIQGTDVVNQIRSIPSPDPARPDDD